MSLARKLATYADLLALPESDRAEILDGTVQMLPAPAARHSRAQGALRRLIGGPYDDDDGAGGPGGWWIFLEVDVELSPHCVVRPDLSGWRRSTLPDPWTSQPIAVVPDWVCEVVSPSSATRDRVTKRRLYLEHLVPWYWLCDPDARTLEVLHRDESRWSEHGVYSDGDRVKLPPFEAVEIDVSRLFIPK
jgi:Uma2 family endonuclease